LAASSDGVGGNTWAYYALGSRRAVAVHDQHTRPQHWAIAQGGVQTRYLWCGDSICQARDAGDAVAKRYFPQGQFNVAGAKKLNAAIDQMGTVRDVLDAATGVKLASFEFDAFGKSTGASGAADIDFRYAGLLNFAPAGLHLATYRAYDPASARWLSRDPIRERGGINLYSYVDGDPVRYVVGPANFISARCTTLPARDAFAMRATKSAPQVRLMRSATPMRAIAATAPIATGPTKSP
jgi:RHS repeat-associated protein